MDVIEILQKIHGHLRGEIDLPSFRKWMVEAQFESEGENDHASQMLWLMDIFYAEYTDGLADRSLWEKSLRHLADQEHPGTESPVVGWYHFPTRTSGISYGVANPGSNSVPVTEPEEMETTLA